MTPTQKEICDELILHANNHEEVIYSMKVMYKSINERILKNYIKKNWDRVSPKRTRISLRNVEYKMKYMILSQLFQKKEKGEISKIFVHINKSLGKEANLYGMYEAIIGKQYLRVPGRELLRGERVELISFNRLNGMQVLIKLENEPQEYVFSIHDISVKHYIELV